MKRWETMTADPARVRALQVQTGLRGPLLHALFARGLETSEALERFMQPRLRDLSDPCALPQMDRAVERIWQAIRHRESIAVYGDYDVDGITSTALLLQVLTRLGAQVTPFLPNRKEDGYGLGIATLQRCMEACRPALLVTVDCGTNSVEAADFARAAGLDLVITDHHEVGETPATALAVINPQYVPDSPLQVLAGVGVTFKLCHALVKQGRADGVASAADFDLRDLLDLVALGTIADIVPLTGENRILVRHGLECLNKTGSIGLQALIGIAGLRTRIDTYHVGYVLGPRLNATGRMGDAQHSLELLLTDDGVRAQALARELHDANEERRQVEQSIAQAAVQALEPTFDPQRDFGLVVAGEGWHVGVIGIVASRLCQQFNRPVIVVGFDADGLGRGSGRSIAGFDLVAGLHACADCLQQFGGHAMAAGLTLTKSALPEFRARFGAACAEQLGRMDLRPCLRVDAWLESLAEADDGLLEEIDQCRPFGLGNTELAWGVRGVRLAGTPRKLKDVHWKMTLAQGSARREAIAFRMGHRDLGDGLLDVVFTLARDEYRGNGQLQLNIKDFALSPAG